MDYSNQAHSMATFINPMIQRDMCGRHRRVTHYPPVQFRVCARRVNIQIINIYTLHLMKLNAFILDLHQYFINFPFRLEADGAERERV